MEIEIGQRERHQEALRRKGLLVVAEMKDAGKSIQMGVVFPVSTHNMGLRYWLAAGGINPSKSTASMTGFIVFILFVSERVPRMMRPPGPGRNTLAAASSRGSIPHMTLENKIRSNSAMALRENQKADASVPLLKVEWYSHVRLK